ncbi:MAG TPA: sulfotransferase [Solirubrobacterales bacterium]
MTLPTFFIIGAAKAGTTSLHFYLDQHPEIQMSAEKEPNFFSGPANGIPYPLGRVDSLAAYERLFDARFEVRGEASVGYANSPRRQGVPERIKELVPDARFVYVVRDPVARTVSHYQHRVAAEGERRSLVEALDDLSDPYSVYLCPSLYARQLELYLSVFPAERILVIDQADLLADREATLREVFSFLSVEESFDSVQFGDELYKGEERRVHPPAYSRLLAPIQSSPLRHLPRGLRRSLRRSVERVLWRPVPRSELDDELRARLEQLFGEEVERLRALTGKPFPSWSI